MGISPLRHRQENSAGVSYTGVVRCLEDIDLFWPQHAKILPYIAMSHSECSFSAASVVDGITIDGPHSRDLDDALWLEEAEEGIRVRVCIPDVQAAIAQDSELDIRARERGFTRYFASGNAPMLPRTLSEDQLSLLPKRSRAVFCIEMTLDANLDWIQHTIQRTVLFSTAQLTYRQVADMVQGDAPGEHQHLRPMLQGLATLSLRLLKKRRQRGELAYYDLRRGWAVSEEGVLKHLSVDEANIGYVIVQEMMLLTNRLIAEHLLASGVPTLFRNHEQASGAPDRVFLARALEEAIAHPEHFDFSSLLANLNQARTRAEYAPHLKGHYGLNVPAYLHFTSPLRRYADLINQRILAARMCGNPSPYTVEQLEILGAELSGLAAAEQEKKRQRYKELKLRETERNLQAQAQRITRLTDKDACRLILHAAKEGEAPAGLVEGVMQRLSDNRISLKEAFALLFQTPQELSSWHILQQHTLAWLSRQPAHIISILALGGSLRNWPTPRYTFTPDETGFYCRAELILPDAEYQTSAWHGSSKRAAQQRAARALCYLLCGVDLPVEPVLQPAPIPPETPAITPALPAIEEDQSNAPPPAPAKKKADNVSFDASAFEETTSSAPDATPAEEVSEPAELAQSSLPVASQAWEESEESGAPKRVYRADIAKFDWRRFEALRAAGDYVSLLYQLCLKTQRKNPAFVFEKPQTPEGTYRCRVTLRWRDGKVISESTGASKMEAKHKAAQAVLLRLQSENAKS